MSARLALPALLCLALTGCVSSQEAAQGLEDQGLEHLRSQRSAEAVAAFEQALDLDPGAHRAAITLAGMLRESGDRTRALRILESLVAAKPALTIGRMHLADTYAELGLDDQAIEHYAAAGAAGSFAPAYLRLAPILIRRRQHAEAERVLLAASRSMPGNPEPYFRLAQLYDQVRHPQARVAWERYVKLARGGTEAEERLQAGEARLRSLGADLRADELAEMFLTLRDDLAPPPPGVEAGAAVIARRNASPLLDRPFVGRIFVAIYAPGAEAAVRGTGQGKTLREAVARAADDVRLNRAYDLFVGARLAEVRIAIDVEADAPRTLTLRPTREGRVDLGELQPGRLALEAAPPGRRSAVLTPSDAATRGLDTRETLFAAALAEVGLAASDWRQADILVFPTRAYAEAGPAGAPVAFEGGLPVLPPVTRKDLAARLVALGGRLAKELSSEGAFRPGLDPRTGATLAAAPSKADDLATARALHVLGERLGAARLGAAAMVAWGEAKKRAVAPEGAAMFVGPSGMPDGRAMAEAALLAMRLKDVPAATSLCRQLAAWLQAKEAPDRGPAEQALAALALARGAALPAPAAERAAWTALAIVVVERLTSLPETRLLAAEPLAELLTGTSRAKVEARAALVLEALAAENPASEAAVRAVAALRRLPPERRPPAALEARVLLAQVQLQYDRLAAYACDPLLPELEGHFRRGPLDPVAETATGARRGLALAELLDALK